MDERPGTDPPNTQDGPTSSPGRSVWTWLLPALTLVAGVALGASVVAAGTAGDDDEEPRASVSAEPSDPAAGGSTSEEDLLVRVPAACLQAADGAEEAAGQFDDVAEAVSALDAARLQELVDRFQQLQPEIQRQADECRSTAGAQLGDGTLVTPTPTPTP